MKKVMIAMIEDNKIIRENIMKFIGFHEEFEVVLGVGSAESFFHEIKSNPKIQIDILLLDIGLPGISGLEALPQLLQWKPDLNVIVLSTYEEEDMILKALCSGACSYISKKSQSFRNRRSHQNRAQRWLVYVAEYCPRDHQPPHGWAGEQSQHTIR